MKAKQKSPRPQSKPRQHRRPSEVLPLDPKANGAPPSRQPDSNHYSEFLYRKTQLDSGGGFEPLFMPDALFDFQQDLVAWSTRHGRSAIFADCGLGKTSMQLAWAENVVRKTNRPVLILTPLAVSAQTIREAQKFDIPCRRLQIGTDIPNSIVVTNYEKLHRLNPDDFSGVVCDESSILKSFNGARRQEITIFMRKVPYRMLCTATAAPNDYVELGTSSEALGYLGHMGMLNRFFKNDRNNSGVGRAYGKAMEWRFKGHAEEPFWRWICSWGRALRKPSDLGFSDERFILPPLTERLHVVATDAVAEGFLFSMPAVGLQEQREERKRTIRERCETMKRLTDDTGGPALLWCHLNAEGDALKDMMLDAVQVSGSDDDEVKEDKLLAFANGNVRRLITKPKIGAWGLNLQHCSHVLFFPSHSYEQYYQGVRRCWRFGQKNPVTVDIVTTKGEEYVLANLQRKAVAADKMFDRLVAHMRSEITVERDGSYPLDQEAPAWA